MCGVCGGKGYSSEICANVVTVFAFEAGTSDNDSYKIISGEGKEAFGCDAPGKFFDKFGEEGCCVLTWQTRGIPVVCDNGASCRMSHSSLGMINYREANATIRTTSGKICKIEGYGDLPLTF